MKTEEFLEQLKTSNLYAECPLCNEEFKLSNSILFDGTKSFPPKSLEIQKQLEESLRERLEGLKSKMKRATVGTQTTTRAVNIGMNLEKILPTLKDFKWHLADCRFLSNPIDFIAFEGLCCGKINSIEFVEVKTGKAHLNEHQKCIKEAVDNKRVIYKEFQ